MTPRETLILLAAVLAIVLAIGLLPPSAVIAQDCPTPLSRAISAIEAQGGHLVDLVEVDTEHADQLLLMEIPGALIMGLVMDGCMVSGPRVVDTVARGTPA